MVVDGVSSFRSSTFSVKRSNSIGVRRGGRTSSVKIISSRSFRFLSLYGCALVSPLPSTALSGSTDNPVCLHAEQILAQSMTTSRSFGDSVPSSLESYSVRSRSRLNEQPLQPERLRPGARLQLATARRNVFFHSDYAEVKEANIKHDRDGNVNQMHIRFYCAKFSPIPRSFDGLCGVVHTLHPDMFLPNHPPVPRDLKRLKYFVTAFGPKVIPRDPVSQRTIEVYVFDSRQDAEAKVHQVRRFPSAVHGLRDRGEAVPLGIVSAVMKGDRRYYRVEFNAFPSSEVHHCKPFRDGRVVHRDFSTEYEAQRFADRLWTMSSHLELPFLTPSRATIVSAARLSPEDRTQQFFTTLRNLTYLSLGSLSRTKAERIARIRLDRGFRREIDAWHHAKAHRPRQHDFVFVPQLPSRLSVMPHRPSLVLKEPLKGAPPKRVIEALGSILPDDPHMTHKISHRVRGLAGVWDGDEVLEPVDPLVVDALRMRLKPAAGNFAQTWELWGKAKAILKRQRR